MSHRHVYLFQAIFWSFSASKTGYSGVVTYARKGLALSVEVGFRRPPVDREEGRAVTVDFGEFVLINIYVPNPSSAARRDYWGVFTDVLRDRVVELTRSGREVIVVGDWNTIPSSKDVYQNDDIYIKEGKLSTVGSKYIERLKKEARMVDPWREANKDERNTFSYWDQYTGKRASNKGCRVDYFLLTTALHTRLTLSSFILTTHEGSDHCPVTLTLRWPFEAEGPLRRNTPELAWRAPLREDTDEEDGAGEGEGWDWHEALAARNQELMGDGAATSGPRAQNGSIDDVDEAEEERKRERDVARYKEALRLATAEDYDDNKYGSDGGRNAAGGKRRRR
ncbi:Class II abasic (AP) endonuclease [Gonapodya sp. JEL0774]|nr:Class II abasic (AP) endonuclease [Gonapodya sp. JEL0774]